MSVAALRNAYSLLMKRLPLWLDVVVAFHEFNTPEHVIIEFWMALGVDPSLTDLLVGIDPWWSGGRLWISIGFQGDPNVIRTLVGLLMDTFLFQRV